MAQSNRARAETFGLFPLYLTLSSVNTLGLRSSCLEGVLLADARLGHGLYRRWGIKTAREYARIKSTASGSSAGTPYFTNAPGHGDDNARFYDRQQAYVHARGG